ncbi:MAG: hypothetical protein ABJ382_22840, partial [Ilumatobacter sp.]
AFVTFAIGPRTSDRFVDTGATLDGIAYLDHDPVVRELDQDVHLADDLPLIEWLRSSVEGTPTIMEMTCPAYQWCGRMSIHTGLPTVIGWPWHQTQQRFGVPGAVSERIGEAEAFYRSDVEGAARFLRRYGVRYVVIGTEERLRGTPVGIAAIQEVPGAAVVFRSGDGMIIEIDQDALADALAATPPSALAPTPS